MPSIPELLGFLVEFGEHGLRLGLDRPMLEEALQLEDECMRYTNLQQLLSRTATALDLSDQGAVPLLLCKRRLASAQEAEEERLVQAAEQGDDEADAAAPSFPWQDDEGFLQVCMPLMGGLLDRLGGDGGGGGGGEDVAEAGGDTAGTERLKGMRGRVTSAAKEAGDLWEEAAEDPHVGGCDALSEKGARAMLRGVVPLLEAPRGLHWEVLRGLQGSMLHLRSALEHPRYRHPGC